MGGGGGCGVWEGVEEKEEDRGILVQNDLYSVSST